MQKHIYRCLERISCTVLVVAALSVASSSPATATDIICHTSDPADCYPRVFQPTENFQVVRDDQDLPPGLHIRLNLNTGLKEARLNIPMDGKEDVWKKDDEQAIIVATPTEQVMSDITSKLGVSASKKPSPNAADGKIVPPRDA